MIKSTCFAVISSTTVYQLSQKKREFFTHQVTSLFLDYHLQKNHIQANQHGFFSISFDDLLHYNGRLCWGTKGGGEGRGDDCWRLLVSPLYVVHNKMVECQRDTQSITLTIEWDAKEEEQRAQEGETPKSCCNNVS